MNKNKNIKYNVVLLGGSKDGKTSILNAKNGLNFEEETLSTIGIESFSEEKIINENIIKFKLYDTPSQERYRSTLTSPITISDGIIIVFGVDESYIVRGLDEWYNTIKENVDIKEKVIYLVGNKIDIDNRIISKEEGQKLANEKNMKYFETSAKTGEGINDVFNEIYNDIYELNKDNRYLKHDKLFIINLNKYISS